MRLSIRDGFACFLVLNVVFACLANPRFPNEAGPMPPALPYIMYGMVLALLLAAVVHPGWRRVAVGFGLGWAALAVATQGGWTVTWTDAAHEADPTYEARRRRRIAAAEERDWAAKRVARMQWVGTTTGREALAREALEVAQCAFRYRELHPEAGFPVSLAELGSADAACPKYGESPHRRADYEVALLPRQRAAGEPMTRLTLRLRPNAKNVGVPYPIFTVDESGLLTVRRSADDAPRPVASPLVATMRLRQCLANVSPLTAAGTDQGFERLLTSAPGPCWPLGTEEAWAPRAPAPEAHTRKICVRVDGWFGCDLPGSAATFLVHHEPLGARPMDGFALRVGPYYGRPRQRSYYVAPDGRVHATGEPRDATEDDPLVLACELRPSDGCR